MKRVLLVLVALGLLVLLWFWFAPDESVPVAVPEPDLRSMRITTAGPVVGYQATPETLAWRGIRYAAAPVGDLRWRAPRLPQPWAEPRLALGSGAACVQFDSPLTPAADTQAGARSSSEDCLFLDVYAPRAHADADGELLPVMVWIHGGGNSIGSNAIYGGEQLAERENVIVVTLNYRLGVFGFFSHPALRATADNLRDASGNFALLDMLLALQWVQNNISNFGGNPDRVTLFGESAGGRNVFSLLASPLSDGLFHRAIVQSGKPGTYPRWRAENYVDAEQPGHRNSSAELVGRQLVDAGLASDWDAMKIVQEEMPAPQLMALLRQRSPEQLLAGMWEEGGMYRIPQNIRDGHVLPADSLLQVFSDPARYRAVPLIAGTNRDEMKVFLMADESLVKQWLGVLPRVQDPQRYNALAAYFSDAWKATSVDEVLSRMAASSPEAPLYAYRFDWDESYSGWLADVPLLLGAAHALEMDFIFGDIIAGLAPGLVTDDNTPGRDALRRVMQGYWARFAYDGDPARGSTGQQPRWQRWGPDGQFLLLDTAADGGLRMTTEGVTMEDIGKRLQDDSLLREPGERCVVYARTFLEDAALTDFFDPAVYAGLGCAEQDPWSLQP